MTARDERPVIVEGDITEHVPIPTISVYLGPRRLDPDAPAPADLFDHLAEPDADEH